MLEKLPQPQLRWGILEAERCVQGGLLESPLHPNHDGPSQTAGDCWGRSEF
jgi:hypothetical protein